MAEATLQSDTDDERPVLPVLFYQKHKRVFVSPLDTQLEIGRQRSDEPSPPRRIDWAASARVILAPLDDIDVSRSHVSLRPLPAGNQIEVVNLSKSQLVRLSSDQVLSPGEKTIVEPPLLAQFSSYAVRVEPPEDEDEFELQPLPERTLPPGRKSIEVGLGRLNIDTKAERLLLRWLETVLGVFQSAAISQDFPELAAKALVKIVELDTAAMLQCTPDGRWQVAALYSVLEDQNEQTWVPSQTLLGRVRKEKRAYRHVPANVSDTAQSLQDISALVAAPILDGAGEVIGALYGDRRSGTANNDVPDITMFEAKLVEVLASGIAAGLARVKEEQAAVAARVQFEQFFTPQLAAQLEQDPALLEGRDAEITLLFADLRSFSRISEILGPALTMTWIQDTMGALSECVLACEGVLVDYLGDELMAMWGAPIAQANHADLACRAAQQMIDALPAINERWQKQLGTFVRLGIGINSGTARVGNTGSRQKFKYGPLGDTVNVASRVQGATKYLGADCLITGSTLASLESLPANRRLARVRVVNIEQPVDLYELACTPPPGWAKQCEQYAQVLQSLENYDLDTAERLVKQLTKDFPTDTAAQALADRVNESQQAEDTSDTSVWCLPGK